ncbi:MAG: hypothetical protein HYT98_01705 [Candidatus Sungbacteria bacterium]|nr:hypothetical protein [Candidatus Sungbacteria bacterium]
MHNRFFLIIRVTVNKNYVQSARASGTDNDKIEEELRKSGWSEDIIKRAIK